MLLLVLEIAKYSKDVYVETFSKYQDQRKIVCFPDQRHVTGLDDKLSKRNKNTDRTKTQ